MNCNTVKIAILMLTIMMVISLTSCVFGGGNYQQDGVEYYVDSDNAIVVNIHRNAPSKLVIPNEIKGVPVESIRIAHRIFNFDPVLIRELILPDTIKSINFSVYYKCHKLQYNEYDNGLYLGTVDNPYFAFIRVKEGEKTVEQYSFNSLNDTTKPEKATAPIPEFYNGTSYVTTCEIHPDTKIIAHSAFANAHNLESIVIPDGVVYINPYAFVNCESLKNVTIGNGVKEIGYRAFMECSSLKSIYISESVENLEGAIWRCGSLESIEVSQDNPYYKSIDGNLYNKDGTILLLYATGKSNEAFIIPEGVTELRGCFSNLNKFKYLVIPSSVTSIYTDDYLPLLEHIYYCGTEESLNEMLYYDLMKYNEATFHYDCDYDNIVFDDLK